MMLKTRELFAGLYAMEDERVRQFLVIGEERALLFDEGFADSGVLETVRADGSADRCGDDARRPGSQRRAGGFWQLSYERW